MDLHTHQIVTRPTIPLLYLGEFPDDCGVAFASVLSSKRDACLGNLLLNERGREHETTS